MRSLASHDESSFRRLVEVSDFFWRFYGGFSEATSSSDYLSLIWEICNAGGTVLSCWEDEERLESMVVLPSKGALLDIDEILSTPGEVDVNAMYVYVYLYARHPDVMPNSPVPWRGYFDKALLSYPRIEYAYWQRRQDSGQRMMVRLPGGK